MQLIRTTKQALGISRPKILDNVRDKIKSKKDACFHYTLRNSKKAAELSFRDYVLSKPKPSEPLEEVHAPPSNRFEVLLDEVKPQMAEVECGCPGCMFGVQPPAGSNLELEVAERHYEYQYWQHMADVSVAKVLRRFNIKPAQPVKDSVCCAHSRAARDDILREVLLKPCSQSMANPPRIPTWGEIMYKPTSVSFYNGPTSGKESSSKLISVPEWEDFELPERKKINKVVKGKKTFKVYSRLLYHLRTKYFLKYRDHHFINLLVNEARIWMVKNEFKCDSATDYAIMSSAVLTAFLVSKEELEFRQVIKDPVNFDNMTHLNATVIGDLGKSNHIPKEHSWLGDRLPNMTLKSRTLDF